MQGPHTSQNEHFTYTRISRSAYGVGILIVTCLHTSDERSRFCARHVFEYFTMHPLICILNLVFFPELLPWVTWCYGTHPLLWCQLGHLLSETGVQQGDPLGPFRFSLVLHKMVSSIDTDDDCLPVLFQAWYIDDGVLTESRSAVLWALSH